MKRELKKDDIYPAQTEIIFEHSMVPCQWWQFEGVILKTPDYNRGEVPLKETHEMRDTYLVDARRNHTENRYKLEIGHSQILRIK